MPLRRGLTLRDGYPHLVAMIHADLNPTLDLATLSAGNGRKLWWKCPEGPDHEWQAVVGNMTRPGAGCPFCAGQRVSVTNSLAAWYPAVAAQWHPSQNCDLTPDTVVFGSNRTAWWWCDLGPDHEWQAQISSRTTGGNGCPFCANKRVSVTNSLAARYPHVAAQWHPTKNGELAPGTVVFGSGTAVWWLCDTAPDHEWQVRIVQRTTMGTNCPCCANQKVSVTNSLAALFPEVAAQLDPARNGGITADRVIAGSNRPLWWICEKGPDHTWRVSPNSRTFDKTGCPACASNQVSSTNSLAALFPPVAAQWHPDRNGPLRPEQVTAQSNKLVWWQCVGGPGHDWQASPSSRTRGRTGCPYCANKKVSRTNSLAARFPEIAAQFDSALNGGLTADQIVAGSATPAVWRCDAGPDHVWSTPVCGRTARDAGCPACGGRQLSKTNSLATRYPEIAAQWHPSRNGTRTPADVISTSSVDRAWWICGEGPDHEWETVIRTRTVAGAGCLCCAGLRLSVTNSLRARHPEIAAQWHPTRNGDRTPDQIVAGSGEAVWWKCPEGPDHEWRVSVDKRTSARTGCPACAGWQVSVANSLANLYPAVAAQLDPTLNDGLTADKVVSRSDRTLVWRCPAGPDHIWPAKVYSRTTDGLGCPCCAGMRLSRTNSLAARFPEVAAELDSALNGGRTPDQVLAGTHKRFTWRCRTDPTHLWTTSVANRTAGDGHGCPTCAVTGFRPTLPAYLYLLRRTYEGQEQRKIGITNVPAARLKKLRRFGWKLIEISDEMDGGRAYELEQAFLRGLLSRGLRRTRSSLLVDRQDGYTETWDYSELPIDSLDDAFGEIARLSGGARACEDAGARTGSGA